MRFVEEEHEFGLVEIARFRQLLEQLGQQPEQATGVHARGLQQLVSGENVDLAAPVLVGLQQILHVEHRLAEEALTALLLDLRQRTLNCADRSSRDVPILSLERRLVVSHELQERA